MKILMKRNQTTGRLWQVRFMLWAKWELEGDERAIIDRYDFDRAILLHVDQPNRIRNAIAIGILSAVFIFFLVGAQMGRQVGSFAAVAGLIATTWFFMDRWRETIYVKDLMYGRNFRCFSIEELVTKEGIVQHASGYMRQVMEVAKNWGGTETMDIPKLDPDLAKQVILKAM